MKNADANADGVTELEPGACIQLSTSHSLQFHFSDFAPLVHRRWREPAVPPRSRARAAATICAYLGLLQLPVGLEQRLPGVVQLGRRDHAVLVRHLRDLTGLSRASSTRLLLHRHDLLRADPRGVGAPHLEPAAVERGLQPVLGRLAPGPARWRASPSPWASRTAAPAARSRPSSCDFSALSKSFRPSSWYCRLPVSARLGFHSAFASATACSAGSALRADGAQVGPRVEVCESSAGCAGSDSPSSSVPCSVSGRSSVAATAPSGPPGTQSRPCSSRGSASRRALASSTSARSTSSRAARPASKRTFAIERKLSARRTPSSATRTPWSCHERLVERLDDPHPELLPRAIEREACRVGRRGLRRVGVPQASARVDRLRQVQLHDVLPRERRLEALSRPGQRCPPGSG